MVKGTRNLFGDEANVLYNMQNKIETFVQRLAFKRFIPSLLAELELFKGKMDDNRMYEFQDRGGRELVLIPEVTAIVQREYRESWSKELPKPVCLFYTSKVFRYDKPQRGRFREFTQFGVEVLGDKNYNYVKLLKLCLEEVGLIEYELKEVKRGLDYYIDTGVEVWKDGLQIAGGGPYEDGVGFAIGLERLLLVA